MEMHAVPMSASASLLGMWVPMMAAMMLPSLVPTLWRYRLAFVRAGGSAPALLTATIAVGYFLVWCGLALITLPFVSPLERLAQGAPIVVGVIVAVAGVLQLTSWKARHLDCCRREARCSSALPSSASAAFSRGVHLGIHCCYCCAGLTAILLVGGDMSLRGMTIATAAITLERLSPGGARIARMIGAVAMCAGVCLIARVT